MCKQHPLKSYTVYGPTRNFSIWIARIVYFCIGDVCSTIKYMKCCRCVSSEYRADNRTTVCCTCYTFFFKIFVLIHLLTPNLLFKSILIMSSSSSPLATIFASDDRLKSFNCVDNSSRSNICSTFNYNDTDDDELDAKPTECQNIQKY